MDLHLSGKVFIVTGGLKGIGKGIALELAREGAIPVIVNRSNITDDFTREIETITTNYRFIQLDLVQAEKIADVVREVVDTYGRIDGIVNNAGVNDNKDLEHTGFEEFESSLRLNLTHYYELVHQAYPHLLESKGSILNIGSKTAVTGQGLTSAYAAAKGAILALTREWAAALAPHGVRANAIVVAESWTPLYEKWIGSFGSEDEQRAKLEAITSKIPLGQRMTTVEEIADTAVFLLSDRSSHTTGQHIYVDGGYVHLDRALS